MKHSNGSDPRVRVQDDGRQVVSQAGSVLLVETVRKTGLDQAISAALAPWRKPRAVHDPGKALLDVALAVALGGDCLADIAMLRCEPAVFGPVASDPTISRLLDTLAASGEKALQAIRSARSEVRNRVWSLSGENTPDADGQVIVDLDGVLVIAHSFVADTFRSLATPTTRLPRSTASFRRSSSCRTGDVVSSVSTDSRTDSRARGASSGKSASALFSSSRRAKSALVHSASTEYRARSVGVRVLVRFAMTSTGANVAPLGYSRIWTPASRSPHRQEAVAADGQERCAGVRRARALRPP